MDALLLLQTLMWRVTVRPLLLPKRWVILGTIPESPSEGVVARTLATTLSEVPNHSSSRLFVCLLVVCLFLELMLDILWSYGS